MTQLAISNEAWAALGVWVTLVPLAVFGILQLRDAKRLRHEETRPFIVAELQNRSILAILALVNVGPTVARNVRASLPNGLTSSHGALDWLDSPAFTDGVANMAPGTAIRFWFDSFPKRTEADLPMRIPLELEYEGPDGRHYGPERYVLDLSAYGPALQPDKNMHDLVEQVTRVDKSIAAIASQISVLANNRPANDLDRR